MSRRKRLPKYKVPKDDDLSLLVYLNANGDLMHMMFASLPIAGVFEWEDGVEDQYDFFIEFRNDNYNDDDDDFFDN
jgi:hypothetical protein